MLQTIKKAIKEHIEKKTFKKLTGENLAKGRTAVIFYLERSVEHMRTKPGKLIKCNLEEMIKLTEEQKKIERKWLNHPFIVIQSINGNPQINEPVSLHFFNRCKMPLSWSLIFNGILLANERDQKISSWVKDQTGTMVEITVDSSEGCTALIEKMLRFIWDFRSADELILRNLAKEAIPILDKLENRNSETEKLISMLLEITTGFQPNNINSETEILNYYIQKK